MVFSCLILLSNPSQFQEFLDKFNLFAAVSCTAGRPPGVCGRRARTRTDRTPLTGTAGSYGKQGKRPVRTGEGARGQVLRSEQAHWNCIYDALEFLPAVPQPPPWHEPGWACPGEGLGVSGEGLPGCPALFRPYQTQLPGGVMPSTAHPRLGGDAEADGGRRVTAGV